ncbi:glycosyltransferase family 4 protein [Microbacterium sp. AK009]|uniref:glycosyltransferase family 4 protein n=1 Tax=Microbacterium sp. AK009 TaxID=2723068 RepID=UPI0035BBAE8A
MHYSSPRQADEWEARHAAGEVPGRWLYGLDRLADDERIGELSVGYLDDWSMRRRLRAAQLLLTSPPRLRSDSPVHLTWDERNALKLITAQREPGAHWTGLIWLTDDVARAPKSRRVRIRNRLLRGISGAWVLSSGQLEVARDLLGSDIPVRLVRFGIDTDFFQLPTAGSPPRKLIVSFGNDRDRDTATLYEAMELVARYDPLAEIVVQTNSNLPVPDGVRRIDRVPHPELRDMYQRASVVVLPTVYNLHFSGMTAALEAMACGAVPVVSDTPGVLDYVRDQVDGFVVPVGDANAIAQTVLDALASPGDLAQLGTNGRDKVHQHHNHRTLSKSLLSAIEGCES